jgi:hypothetical protein
MSKSTLCTIFAFFPFLALAGSIGLLERVPNLPNSAEAALSGRAALAATVQALQRDIDAAQDALDAEADVVAEKSIESAEQQQRNVEKFTGMSAAEMESADEDEVEGAMLQGFGLNMADMDAMENMSDAEIEAYMAGKQINTQKASEFAAGAPKISDPKKFERLTREFGDWQSGEVERITKTQEEWKALMDRWAQDHAQLNTRLNKELASEESQVSTVDCGEAGDEPDALAVYAIKLKRAKAHAQLAPEYLKQGQAFLADRRRAVKTDVDFADKFAADAAGVDEMAAQSIIVQQTALQRIGELSSMTLEINDEVAAPMEALSGLEKARPKSECG